MGNNAETPFGTLFLKTLESVLEVVLLSAGGYILAKNKVLPKDSQKTISNINMNLFTPCLVASKLAGSLSTDQLIDLWLLPIVFVLLTGVSWIVGKTASKVMGLPSKQTRFVIGCTVFQNSNSLPLALVSALAYSLDGLWWDQRAPHDNDEAVASRGILYLLVFSQLGLSIRWSYGYNYLFAAHRPGDRTENASLAGSDDEEAGEADERSRLLSPSSPSRKPTDAALGEPTLRRNTSTGSGALTQFPALTTQISQTRLGDRVKTWPLKALKTLWGFMNPPLWAMLIALVVACVPGLQPFFFTKGTFVFNSLTTAVTTAGNCAVPLILVVLGGNLAQEKGEAGEPLPHSKRTIWTAIVSRMVLVPLVLLPLLAIIARFAPISVVDDPIFIVVLFLLIGSPTAIQVASICQLNDVFEEEIATICWYSYAILTMPTTLILVVLSLEVVKLNRLGPWMMPP
ncbi:auxin efflux carrier [Protomyces lactucae-debilis]|uniref:Auxin efflux carrier n=1 Tax=Protomyces lactucae-debilis TaxID=2754530 RepID=A0A1Y2FAZ7_PROLT|nr:auxin efflux carrier [Protomyces lactucae-debilis]ORY80035.1 auxin efflux carrier [Protomyces lactucae-debilis]